LTQLVSWQALGTNVHVLVENGDPGAARAAVSDILDQVDQTYSRFRSDSELSELNRQAGRTVTLSPLLARAVAVALRAARLTDGLVDPTVGRAMRLIGYDDDFAKLPRDSGPLNLHLEPVPGWRVLRFEERAKTLYLPRGVEIDLGSTGKAFAADLAVEAAHDASRGSGVLVSLGGDISTAGEPPDGGWRVLVADDSNVRPDAQGEVIALSGGAVATSSTSVRRWSRGGVQLHHLVDPGTGLPVVTPWRTVTVIARNCVDANIAATAAMIGGATQAEWLARLGLSSRLVNTEGSVTRVAGWPMPAAA
jgi:thiamine biosynthesis lipoprotein ApbE